MVRLNQNATFTARQDAYPAYNVSYGRTRLVAVPHLGSETTPCGSIALGRVSAFMGGSWGSRGAGESGLRILRFDNATGGWQTWRSDLPTALQAVANFPTLYPRDLLLVAVDMDLDWPELTNWRYELPWTHDHLAYTRFTLGSHDDPRPFTAR